MGTKCRVEQTGPIRRIARIGRIGVLLGLVLIGIGAGPALAAANSHPSTWETAVRMRARQHGLAAAINHQTHIVGIAGTPAVAQALTAYRPMAWKLEANRTLRENLSHWARRSGWNLRWNVPMNYLIDQPVVLVGPFTGSTGVVAQVMNAYRDARTPLRAVFHDGNHVLEILPYQR